MKLKDKVAIITGGTRGIGLGCARVFARHGASVVMAARDAAEGQHAEKTLRDAGLTTTFARCDVTLQEDMRSLIDGTADRFGRLDCLVNNAGWHPPAMSIDEIDVEDFESLLRLNLTSTFMGCKFAMAHLRRTRGSIVNMSSAVALVGQSSAVSYVSTKAGQIGMTRALALDVASDGVRVNAVCPAGVMTPLVEQWAQSEYDPAAAIEMVHRWHPLGRMARADEVGELCAFLASDEASFITGQAISPDGGAMLGYGPKAEVLDPDALE